MSLVERGPFMFIGEELIREAPSKKLTLEPFFISSFNFWDYDIFFNRYIIFSKR